MPSLAVKSVPELIALAKSKPAALNYGSVGNGSQPHLAAEMFKQMTGVDFTHIPYKGAAPAITDLLAGQIDLAFLNAPPLLPHIQSGKLNALAVTTMKRARQLPDLPTLDELGLAGLRCRHLVRHHGAGRDAEAGGREAHRGHQQGAHLAGRQPRSSPRRARRFSCCRAKEFADYLQQDAARLTKLIKSANIQAE